MRQTITILLLIIGTSGLAQKTDSLKLANCRQQTIKKYPLNKDFDHNIEVNNLKIQNIKTIYLPVLNLTGQVYHVADVPHYVTDNPMIQIPQIGKDQYKIMLEARQVIYDGGLIKRQKAVEESSLQVNNQSIETKLFTLNEQVNEIYFLILIFQEQQNLLKLTQQTLNEQLKVVSSGVKNGVLLPGDADVLKAEILKLEQSIIELDAGKKNGLEILSLIMDTTLTKEVYLKIPSLQTPNEEQSINRPEHILMQYQQNNLDNVSKLNGVKRFPYFGAFGTFGYGYPGMNMLEDEAAVIYTFGLNLSWNIWDWNKNKREKQIFSVQQDMINTQREVFDKNLNIALSKEKNDIDKLSELLINDEKIIVLQERISRTKASQLKNGVITSTDYIREFNAETMSKIKRTLHELQRLKAIVKYNTLKGNLLND
ncbi:MAG: TolC family protein [Bacteroidota bacterium]